MIQDPHSSTDRFTTEVSDFEVELHKYLRFGSKLGLGRMKSLLAHLGNPQEGMQVIHVAGTNGKGSVCKYIACALQEAGYSVGLYISPYITCFRERIQLNGEFIDEDSLNKYGAMVLEAARAMESAGEEPPTEFELVTALGFLYYASKKTDFIVLEVGLGGRGDSTNVFAKPAATVITGISFDHMERLGDTLEKIAYEKAGIIKEGVPMIMNVDDPGANRVIREEAEKFHAPIVDITGSTISHFRPSPFGTYFDGHFPAAMGLEKDWDDVLLSMGGKHQCHNALLAIATIENLRLRGIIKMDKKCLFEGLKKAVQPCRFERMELRKKGDYEGPLFVLDGAHNAGAWDCLTEAVFDTYPGKKIWLITGVLADKEVRAIIPLIYKLGARKVLTVDVPNPRTLPSEEYAKMFPADKMTVTSVGELESAMGLAKDALKNGDIDLCLVAGSLYLVSVARKILLHWEEEGNW